MKKFTTVIGASLFAASSVMAPVSAKETPSMAAYNDCIDAHADIKKDIDFKELNQFCTCVADQETQGTESGLSDCAVGNNDSGGTFGMIGEVAPAVLQGVVEGILSNPESLGSLFGNGDGLDLSAIFGDMF